MISKNKAKTITSLGQKKYRLRENLFVAEGVKVIGELLDSDLELEQLFVEVNSAFAKALKEKNTIPFVEVTPRELSKVTFLKTSQTALAIFKIPQPAEVNRSGLTLVLDDIRDPGNLGTIIRLCDWFGIEQLVCSSATVDCYNPKVVQASMGSLTRVQIIYTELHTYLEAESRPVFGTFMDGDSIYTLQLPSQGVIVMGNEARGISAMVKQRVSRKIAIPRFGKMQMTESLNVATAASICLSEFRRNS